MLLATIGHGKVYRAVLRILRHRCGAPDRAGVERLKVFILVGHPPQL